MPANKYFFLFFFKKKLINNVAVFRFTALYLLPVLYWKCFVSNHQAEITKCVVKKDLTPENNWLSSTVESLKYFLTTVYVYVMKEP